MRRILSIVLSLRGKLLLLTFLMLCPVFGLLIFNNFKQRETEKAAVHDRLVATSKIAAFSQRNFFEKTRQILSTLTQFPFLVESTDRSVGESAFSNLKLLSPDYLNFGLIQPDGTLLCDALQTNEVIKLGGRSDFQQVMQTRRFSVGHLEKDPLVSEPCLNFAYPVLKTNGEIRRVLFASLKLDLLSQGLSEVALPEGGVLMVVDPIGNILASYPDSKKWVGNKLPIEFQKVASGKYDSFEDASMDGISRIYAVTPVLQDSIPNVFAIVGIPRTASYAQANQALLQNLIAIVGITAVAFLLAWLFSRRLLLNPIHSMVSAADRLSNGDLSARAGLDNDRGELGRLARAFDTMAEKLTGRQQELEKANAEIKEFNSHLKQSVRDVSLEVEERKKHEQMEIQLRKQAQASEERFRILVERSLVGIYVIQDDRFIYVNPGMEKILGYTSEEIASRSLLDIIAPEDRALVKENVRKRMEGITIEAHYNLRMLRRDQSVAEVEARGGRIEYNGRTAIMGTLLDISERKRAERNLREQAALLDKAQDAIYVRDFDQRITYWNRAAERIYGWTAAEVIGQRADEFIYKNIAKEFIESQKSIYEKGELTIQLKQATKAGKEIIVEERSTLLRDEDGKPTSILNINTDITEKKKMEDQFLRAQRMESIGTLAGGIAHDLNNVLAPILMAVQLLKMKGDEPSEDEKMLDTIDTAARRGAGLVQQVLSFARGTEGSRTVVPIKHLVADQEKIVRETFPKSIQLETGYDRDMWNVSGDATQLYQVMLNLCVNARDAMPNGGKLRIHARNIMLDEPAATALNIDAKPGPYAVITVADSGTGIPREIMDKIFDPFFTTKEVGKGTGLGLSTLMGIVKSHNGFVHVYSEVGNGTEFKIYLPALVNSTTAAVTKAAMEFPDGNKKLILVVDDEPTICSLSQTILTRNGYRVLTAAEGTQAIALYALHKSEIALVITDMSMPYMDGQSTIRALERMNPDVKILAVSGIPGNARVAQSSGNGTVAFLQKPYSGQALLALVTQLLDNDSRKPATLVSSWK